MKSVKCYIEEAKQNFLVKGHTKKQKEYTDSEKLYDTIDNQINKYFNNPKFEFSGHIKNSNDKFQSTSWDIDISKFDRTVINTFLNSIKCPELQIHKFGRGQHIYYEIVYNFGGRIGERWIYNIKTEKSLTKNEIKPL